MAPQMVQGRHFPGDPPADQFPNSGLDVISLATLEGSFKSCCIQLFDELIFDQRLYIVLLQYIYVYRLYLVWSTKLYVASKAMP